MTTLSFPQTATVTVTVPGAFITVTCATGDVMQVDWISPGSITGSHTVRQITGDVGPFADSTVVTLRALSGSPQYTDAQGGGLTAAQVVATQALVSGAAITADDTGSAWTLCPALLSLSATLTAGTSTTVLLEVRTEAGTVTTAATIVADTLTTQTLRQAFLTREVYEYRLRRSSGTGTVVIYF